MGNILECKNLRKQYGKLTALNGIDLELPEGKIVGLLGPNGSGKTTLIKLTCGLLVPTSGEIKIGGFEPGIQSKKIISYLPERNYLNDYMTVNQLINFFSDFYSDFDKNKAIDMLARLNIDSARKLKTLSKGTKEKVQLIMVMSRKARLYILDEPIGGVDPAARDYILETIISNYNENATVLISTHLIADIETVLDEFVFIKNGEIIRQSSVDTVRDEQGMSIDALFREEFKC